MATLLVGAISSSPVHAAAPVISGLPGSPVLLARGASYNQDFTVTHAEGTTNVIYEISESVPSLITSSLTPQFPGGTTVRLPITAASGASGVDIVTVVAKNPSNTSQMSTANFTVIVNDPPTIDSIATVNMSEDGTGTVTVVFSDTETANSGLTLSYASTNTSLIAVSGITTNSSNASQTVLFLDTEDDQFGESRITVTVTDPLGQTAETSFQLVVASVNDAPVITSASPLTMDEDTTNTVTFVYSDIEDVNSNLTFSVSLGSQQLFNTSGVTTNGFTGTGIQLDFVPQLNNYGSETVTVAVVDSEGLGTTNDYVIVVNPVNDPPTLSGLFNGETGFIPDSLVTNLFTSLAAGDVDYPRMSQTFTVTVSVPNASKGQFKVGDDLFNSLSIVTNSLTGVDSFLQGIQFQPIPNLLPVGQTNTLDVTVTVRDQDNASIVKTDTINILSINDPPLFFVIPGPQQDADGPDFVPYLDMQIIDPDLNESFVLTLEPSPTNAPSYGSFSTSPLSVSGSLSTVEDFVEGLTFDPDPNAVAGLVDVVYTFTLRDSGDPLTTNVSELVTDVTFSLLGENRDPEIGGIITDVQNMTDGESINPFSEIVITDPDLGGTQLLSISVSVDNPAYGSIVGLPTNNSNVQEVATILARSLEFQPNGANIPFGDSVSVVLTITVTDSAGGFRSDSNTRISITNRNDPPEIEGVPDLANQPLLLSPDQPVRPFAQLAVTNDDTNDVTFTIALDVPEKGTLSNLGGFTNTVDGYLMTGSTSNITASLAAMIFTPSTTYDFPPNEPGGTRFDLEAEDINLLRDSASLSILVQAQPRNWLITRTDDDTDPGSLRFAVNHAANGDVMTFAFDSYPQIIRLASPLVLDRNASLRGPGADLLTISGDRTGNLLPDTRIFEVTASVEIDGVTLSRGTALTGGAVYVGPRGHLTLRNSVVAHSLASQWGGGIDVEEGGLLVQQCLFVGNSTDASLGKGGGAISLYTDEPVRIENCTFAQNTQAAVTGKGGGALAVENFTPAFDLDVLIDGCTFAENVDEAGEASSILADTFGAEVSIRNTIFNDAQGKTLQVAGGSLIRSEGGNISDDSTQIPNSQGGTTQIVLLDHSTDLTNRVAQLAPLDLSLRPMGGYPLQASSPAQGLAVSGGSLLDQRGGLRGPDPDSGALESGGTQRIVLNELQAKDDPVDFLELYAQRDSTPVDLSNFQLVITGVVHHTFAPGTIIQPGFGILVGDSSQLTGHAGVDVVDPSIPLDLPERAQVKLLTALPLSQPVFTLNYVDVYVDQSTTNSNLSFPGNSITLTPQFSGVAYVPHSAVLPPPLGGADFTRDVNANTTSPGSDSGNTPFGLDNAFPSGTADHGILREDDLLALNVLANDIDADGLDILRIVEVAGAPAPWPVVLPSGALAYVETNDVELLVLDPRPSALFQSLPVGAQISTSLTYSVTDFGTGLISAYADNGGSTLITSPNHRLSTNEVIRISGSAIAGYNGEFAVIPVNDNQFSISKTYEVATAPFGAWETVSGRTPSTTDVVTVSLSVLGANDPPSPANDVVNTTEEQPLRIMADADLAGTVTVFATDGDYPAVPVISTNSLLINDIDIDTDDDFSTLRVVGVVGAVTPLNGFSASVSNANETIVTANGHGLVNGDEVLISGYGGHPSYNGRHLISLLDTNRFTIPVAFIDNNPTSGVAAVFTESSRFNALSKYGAEVTFEPRTDRIEDSIVYNPQSSSILNGLAITEQTNDLFYVAVRDRQGAESFSTVTIIVDGVNDLPVLVNDPPDTEGFDPYLVGSNLLASVVLGAETPFILPADKGAELVTVRVIPEGGAPFDLGSIHVTDEETALYLSAEEFLVNDSDVDRSDELFVQAVEAVSLRGASLSLVSNVVEYNPVGASNLNALVREQVVLDLFDIEVSDGTASVTSAVIVVVVGLNDTPVGGEFVAGGDEDHLLVQSVLETNGYLSVIALDSDADIDGDLPDDRLRHIPSTNLLSSFGLPYVVDATNLIYDPRPYQDYIELAIGQSLTDTVQVYVTDGSFLFANDDFFRVAPNGAAYTLDVLANDADFGAGVRTFELMEVEQPETGGFVTILGSNGLSYTPPVNFVGDEHFRYRIENPEGEDNWALVTVRSTQSEKNGSLIANPDAYTVAKGQAASLNVLLNDHVLGTPGLSVTRIVSSSLASGDMLQNQGDAVLFTQGSTAVAFPYTASFRYELSGGGSAVAEGVVTIRVIDRENTLPVNPDFMSVPVNSTAQSLDVLFNDRILAGETGDLNLASSLVTPPSHGDVVVDSGSPDRLLYTPDPNFIGVDRLVYQAVDGNGGTGTAAVEIVVGTLAPANDFAGLAATGTSTVDVLANDIVLPQSDLTISIASISSSNLPNGTLSIAGNRKSLVFVGNGNELTAEVSYTIQDGGVSNRFAEATLELTTQASGLRANSDRFRVLGDGLDYELDVLGNDRAIPDEGRSLSLVAVGTGVDAPNHGGTVTVSPDGQRLLYTPASGFVGQETFTYDMTDTLSFATARVIVDVRDGTLQPGNDIFTVYYEDLGDGPVSFDLPLLQNDRVLPSFGQLLEVVGVGIDDPGEGNAPDQMGDVEVSPDGSGLLYTPGDADGPFPYVERFTYEVSDGAGEQRDARVTIHVLERTLAQDPETHDDVFAVAQASLSNVLPVLGNDGVRPGNVADWEITSVTSPAYGGQVTISGQALLYTPQPDFIGTDSFTYSVNDGLGGTGEGTVLVKVGNRSVNPDRFEVVADGSSYLLDVLANDEVIGAVPGPDGVAAVAVGTRGGLTSVDGDAVRFTPNPVYTGSYPYQEEFTYQVEDASGIRYPGIACVTVYAEDADRDARIISLIIDGRNDRPILDTLPTLESITDKESTYPLDGLRIIEVDQQRQELVCVRVELENTEQGVLTGPAAFTNVSEDVFELCGVTASNVSSLLADFHFTPIENRIPVPLVETAKVRVTVTDVHLASTTGVANVAVESINDAPWITGTLANQEFDYLLSIRPFPTVSIYDVDNLAIQPLDITVQIVESNNGELVDLGSFNFVTTGVYRAEGLSPQEATANLRQLRFVSGTNVVEEHGGLLTRFVISVDDRFADPVENDHTTVIARNVPQVLVQPEEGTLQKAFGLAVDAFGPFAMVGAPNSDTNGTFSGAALVYHRVPGTTNDWEEMQLLLPATVDEGDRFGRSVSMDCELAAVGASGTATGAVEVGSVYLYERDLVDTNAWTELAWIHPAGVTNEAAFGLSVSLDGDYLAVGAPSARLGAGNPQSGAVFVFHRHAGGTDLWGEVFRFSPTNAVSELSRFGWSVLLREGRLFVGAPEHNLDLSSGKREGIVYRFEQGAGIHDWSLAGLVTPGNPDDAEWFGWSLSATMNHLAVGAPKTKVLSSGDAGMVHLYRLDAGAIVQTNLLEEQAKDTKLFGYSLSVRDDALLVGAPENTGGIDYGAAYLYIQDLVGGTNWVLRRTLRRDQGDNVPRFFGRAVSFRSETAVIGAPSESAVDRGRVYFYRFGFNRAPLLLVPFETEEMDLSQWYDSGVLADRFMDPDGDPMRIHVMFPGSANGFAFDGMSVTGMPIHVGYTDIGVMVDDCTGASTSVVYQVLVTDSNSLLSVPRQIWNGQYFGPLLADSSQEATTWGGDADPNGDGASNDQEYVFGGDPLVSDSIGILLVQSGANEVSIWYERRTNDPQLDFMLEGTSDLDNWVNLDGQILSETITPIDSETEEVLLRVGVDGGTTILDYRIIVVIQP